MRRFATATCIVGALTLLLALVGPGAALAHGRNHRGHHGSAHHHGKKARRHKSRLERLVPVSPSGSTGMTGTTGKTAETEKGAESAGKVKSFEKGVLTLTLNDGSTVSGNVTEETKIKCEGPAAKMSDWHGEGGSWGGGSDDDRGMGGMHENCSASSLVPEALVANAVLRISATGSTFVEIELIVQPTTTEKPVEGGCQGGRHGGQQGGDLQDD